MAPGPRAPARSPPRPRRRTSAAPTPRSAAARTTRPRRTSPTTSSAASASRTATPPRRWPAAPRPRPGACGRTMDLPGLPRAAVGDRVARLRRQLVVSSATQGAFATRQRPRRAARPPARPRARPRHPARRRVRRQAHAARAAGGRRGARAAPPGARRAHAQRRTSPPRTPRPAELLDARGRRLARRHARPAIRGRVVCDRGMNEEFGVEAISSLLAAGPYRWRAHELARLRRADEPRRAPAPTAAPGAPPAAFAVETLLDELAAELGIDPLELRLRNVLVEGDRGIDGDAVPAVRRQRVPRARARAPAVARARRACPPARASAWRSASGPAASSPRRRPAGSTPTAS